MRVPLLRVSCLKDSWEKSFPDLATQALRDQCKCTLKRSPDTSLTGGRIWYWAYAASLVAAEPSYRDIALVTEFPVSWARQWVMGLWSTKSYFWGYDSEDQVTVETSGYWRCRGNEDIRQEELQAPSVSVQGKGNVWASQVYWRTWDPSHVIL